MGLCEEYRERLSLSEDDFKQLRHGGAAYEFIHEKRKAAFNRMYANAQTFVDSIQNQHDQSQQFLHDLRQFCLYPRENDISKIKKFILERNYKTPTAAQLQNAYSTNCQNLLESRNR